MTRPSSEVSSTLTRAFNTRFKLYSSIIAACFGTFVACDFGDGASLTEAESVGGAGSSGAAALAPATGGAGGSTGGTLAAPTGGTSGGSVATGGASAGSPSSAGGTAGFGGTSSGNGGGGGLQSGGASAAAGNGGNAGSTEVFLPCPQDRSSCRILPLGDSLTLGTPIAGGYRMELLHRAYADGKHATFVGSQKNGPSMLDGQAFPQNHEGYASYTIDQIKNDVLPKIASSTFKPPPHIILLMIGTNDMNAAATADPVMAASRLGPLLDTLVMMAPKALIAVGKIPPLGATQSGAANVKPYNDALAAVVQERIAAGKHLVLVDHYGGFNPNDLGDGIHPTEQGYDLMGATWYAAINLYLL